MSISEMLKKLDDLYEKTGDDWHLEISHCLTEPTCPTVVISREGSDSARYRFDRDTIEEGIEAAVEAVYKEMILGNKVDPECPFTNPDDLVVTEEMILSLRKLSET